MVCSFSCRFESTETALSRLPVSSSLSYSSPRARAAARVR